MNILNKVREHVINLCVLGSELILITKVLSCYSLRKTIVEWMKTGYKS